MDGVTVKHEYFTSNNLKLFLIRLYDDISFQRQRSTKNLAATIRLPIQTVFTEQLLSCPDFGFNANKYEERTIFCVVSG